MQLCLRNKPMKSNNTPDNTVELVWGVNQNVGPSVCPGLRGPWFVQDGGKPSTHSISDKLVGQMFALLLSSTLTLCLKCVFSYEKKNQLIHISRVLLF